MSTEIESRTKFGLVQYWGGDASGMKIQITEPDGEYAEKQNLMGAVQLNAAEALVVAEQLREFAVGEIKRRQKALRAEIEGKVEFENTIFRELAELKVDDFAAFKKVSELMINFTGGVE